MYENLRILLNSADVIGKVTAVHMDENWLPSLKRVSIEGTTKTGEPFVLNLEVGSHDRSES